MAVLSRVSAGDSQYACLQRRTRSRANRFTCVFYRSRPPPFIRPGERDDPRPAICGMSPTSRSRSVPLRTVYIILDKVPYSKTNRESVSHCRWAIPLRLQLGRTPARVARSRATSRPVSARPNPPHSPHAPHSRRISCRLASSRAPTSAGPQPTCRAICARTCRFCFASTRRTTYFSYEAIPSTATSGRIPCST